MGVGCPSSCRCPLASLPRDFAIVATTSHTAWHAWQLENVPEMRVVAKVCRPLLWLLLLVQHSQGSATYVQTFHPATADRRAPQAPLDRSTDKCLQSTPCEDREDVHALSASNCKLQTCLSWVSPLSCRLRSDLAGPVAPPWMSELSVEAVWRGFPRDGRPWRQTAGEPSHWGKPEGIDVEVGASNDRPFLQVPLAQLKTEISRLEKHFLDMPVEGFQALRDVTEASLMTAKRELQARKPEGASLDKTIARQRQTAKAKLLTEEQVRDCRAALERAEKALLQASDADQIANQDVQKMGAPYGHTLGTRSHHGSTCPSHPLPLLTAGGVDLRAVNQSRGSVWPDCDRGPPSATANCTRQRSAGTGEPVAYAHWRTFETSQCGCSSCAAGPLSGGKPQNFPHAEERQIMPQPTEQNPEMPRAHRIREGVAVEPRVLGLAALPRGSSPQLSLWDRCSPGLQRLLACPPAWRGLLLRHWPPVV